MFFQVLSPEIVHTVSFRGDVHVHLKQSDPEYWLVLTFSCYFPVTLLTTIMVVSQIDEDEINRGLRM